VAYLRVVLGLLRALLVGAVVCLASWLLVECAPGATAERAAIAGGAIVEGAMQGEAQVRSEIIAEVAKQQGLDGSVVLRLASRSAGALVLRFGTSWQDQSQVSRRLGSREGMTTLVLCLSALLIALFGALLGARRSARDRKSPWHLGMSAMAALALSIPIAWLAMMSLDALAFGHPFSFAPKGGMDGPLHGVLPVFVLAAAPMSVLWRHLSERMIVVAREPWVVAARARGVSEASLWNRQILKVALPTALALVPVMLAYLLAAAIVVESVFAIDGVGSMVARAAAVGDAPVLIAFASVTSIFMSATSQGVDALVRVLDPRRGPAA